MESAWSSTAFLFLAVSYWFFSFITGSLTGLYLFCSRMSAAVLCMLLPALGAPCLPRLACTLLVSLEFSLSNSSRSSFPRILSSVPFLNRSECFHHLLYCFPFPILDCFLRLTIIKSGFTSNCLIEFPLKHHMPLSLQGYQISSVKGNG